MASKAVLDPVRAGLLRSRGVVLGHACFMDLIQKSHGCSMARKVIHANIRDEEGRKEHAGRGEPGNGDPDARMHGRTGITVNPQMREGS